MKPLRSESTPRALWRRACSGAGVGFAVCGLALVAGRASVPESTAGLGLLFAVVTLGGALGGVVFHYLEPFREQGGGWRAVANIAGALAYLVILAVAFGLGTHVSS